MWKRLCVGLLFRLAELVMSCELCDAVWFSSATLCCDVCPVAGSLVYKTTLIISSVLESSLI